MKFGFDLLRKMTIPIPSDEEVLLVPRSQIWTGQWEDVLLVFTDKGIHFRVKKSHLINFESGEHSLADNTFFAYNRIANYKRGSGLWSKTYIITMVDGLTVRFFFKKIDQAGEILNQRVRLDQPRDMRPYSYSSHHPERGDYREVGMN
jgi:hypothetical protein